MAEAKTFLMFLDSLGVPIFGYTLFINIGELKGFILFAIALLYGIARLIFYVIRNVQETEMRRLKIKEKELDIDEREHE